MHSQTDSTIRDIPRKDEAITTTWTMGLHIEMNPKSVCRTAENQLSQYDT